MAESSASPAGEATESSPPELGPEGLRRAYRAMVVARTMDERCLTLQRQGRIGFYAPMQGQEAAQVGSALALAETDWIFPAYRELGVALVRGITPKVLFDQFIGNSDDAIKGRQMPNHYGYSQYHYVSVSSPVGTQITHAVGAAMAAQRKGARIVTITYFGDGTTSSNDFHAGLNMAGVFQTPTIFFCQNNEWAISVPREHQTHSATLAEKATAYGFPGFVVDGTDVRAVYRVVSEARRHALAGKGPTLIEAQVYRLGPHSTSDDPRRYRSDEEVQKWRARDPVDRLRHDLLAEGLLTEDDDSKLRDEVKAEVAAAWKAAEAAPPVDPMTLFDDVLSQRPTSLEEERAQFDAWIRAGVLRP